MGKNGREEGEAVSVLLCRAVGCTNHCLKCGPTEGLSCGKELYVLTESQMGCDYCFKGYSFSLCVDRCICAGYFSISTWVDEGSSTLQVSSWRCWYTDAVYIK